MYRRIPLSIEVKKVLRMLMYTLMCMLLAVSAYFFIKTSNTAEMGYQLRENQIKQKTLEAENRILKQHVLDAQSLNKVQSSGVVKKMEQPVQQIFVRPKGPLSRKN